MLNLTCVFYRGLYRLNELPLDFKEFNVPLPDDMELLDYEVMQQMQQVTLLGEVKETIEYLHQKVVCMYILSNSIFMGSSAWKLLESFGINQYFKNNVDAWDIDDFREISKIIGLDN